ncbi:putative RNA-directed DNA polymerase [Tanacetum coccineum]
MKCTSAIRQLAYGVTPDSLDEYLQMGSHCARDCLDFFTMCVIELFMPKYLRKPDFNDIQKLYTAHNNIHGFPGMLGSIDCMHWEWRNCPKAWHGQFGRGDKKYPTILLEAVASYDLWIWHAFFGVAGANNDLTVLNNSPLFDDLLDGIDPVAPFECNGVTFEKGYYLADAFTKWASFVKSFTVASSEKNVLYKRKQEGARKDIERAFGVLQGRWRIISQPARAWTINKLRRVMHTCIILHNMILEDQKNGKRYGFVRFKFVTNVEELLKRLKEIKFGEENLKVFIAYDRKNLGVRGDEVNRNVGNEMRKESCWKNNGWNGGTRDERNFVEVVNGEKRDKDRKESGWEGRNDAYRNEGGNFMNKEQKEDVRTVEVCDDEVNTILFNKCLIVEVKSMCFLTKLGSIYGEQGLSNVEVKLLGGLEVLMVFDTPDLRRWNKHYILPGRITWINIIGVPVSCWSESVFKKIAALHGRVIGSSNCKLEGNQNLIVGKVQLHTTNKGLIKESLYVKLYEKKFKVDIIEVGDVIEFEIDEKGDIGKIENDHKDPHVNDMIISDSESSVESSDDDDETDSEAEDEVEIGIRLEDGDRKMEDDERTDVDNTPREDVCGDKKNKTGENKSAGNLGSIGGDVSIDKLNSQQFGNGPIGETGLLNGGYEINQGGHKEETGEKRVVHPTSYISSGDDRANKKRKANGDDEDEVVSNTNGNTSNIKDTEFDEANKNNVFNEGVDNGARNGSKKGGGGDKETFVFRSTGRADSISKGCSVDMEQVKEIGEIIGVSWAKAENKNAKDVETVLREGEKKDDHLKQNVDIRSFTYKEGTGDERFVAVKGEWKGKDEDVNLACIYGPHVGRQKACLWERIRGLMDSSKGAWCIFEDLNVVRGIEERRNSQVNIKEMTDFNDFINDAKIIEILTGAKDHCPIVLKDVDLDFGPKPFRAFNIWLEERDIRNVVEEEWKIEVRSRRSDFCFRDKLKNVKSVLKKWSKERFRAVNEKIELFKKDAMKWELEAKNGTLSEVKKEAWMKERKSRVDKENKLKSMLYQKARIKWDIEGDENSKFFHSVIKRRNNKSNIRGLMVNGMWCEDPNLIKAEVFRHYKTLFSERGSIRLIFCSDRVEKFSVDDAGLVEKEFTKEEILEAVRGCGGDKAPGLDGFNFKYIRKFWDILKTDLVSAIKWFRDNMEISRGCNSSFVTIIPKVTDPIGLGDFRPIRLIGCYYKIIAKVWAKRIKKVVGKVVGDVQNAFIKGRYILDGVLIANEVVGHMRKIQSKGLIFKVDFEKAYDSLNRRFLIDIMKKIGFGIKWCKWIESCLRSSTVSILVNGSPTDELCLERGVRQVSHLQYADDTIFFGEWNKENAKTLMCILKCFEEVSGLRVNYNKSKLYEVGVNEGEMRDMVRWMRCGVGEFPFTYLRLPIGKNMRRVEAWNSVVVKFKNRLANWKAKSMSTGGRLTLVKSVLGSLPLVGDELEGLGLEFISSFVREVRNGNDIRFWVDIWVGGVRLCDLFPRLYHLDRSKEGRVVEKRKWVDNVWCWE